MKKMCKFGILNFVLVLFVSVCICSCGKDDDSNSVRKQLEGVWKTSMRSDYWKRIELVGDGTLHYCLGIKNNNEYYYDGLMEYRNKLYWTYNETDQTISMYRDDGYFSYVYKVNMAPDGNSWVGYEINGGKGTFTFTRVQNATKIENPNNN